MDDGLIIIGGGLAGLSAALAAAKQGQKCVLVSVQPSQRAQSALAEGGISGAAGKDPLDIEAHRRDTQAAGQFLADSRAVKKLALAAPEIIEKLGRLGVPFNRERDGLALRQMGGHGQARTAFVKNRTGKAVLTALIDEVRKYEAQGLVRRLSHHAFIELALQGEICAGCTVRDCYTGRLYGLKGPVLLASGGLSGLFPGCATGTRTNDGSVAAAVFRQGVELANLEFIQYHPTTFPIPGKRRLVSEAARSAGGRLFVMRNGGPWYFMEELHPQLGNLAPRDVISREMEAVRRQKDCAPQVYLDMSAVKKEAWRERLPDLREECLRYLRIDPEKEPILVEPGIHYFMGGIRVDACHRASKKRLYAAGECACQYHGANRLGGNSMLGAIYGGAVAARQAMEDMAAGEIKTAPLPPQTRDWPQDPAYAQEMKDILRKGLGLCRTERELSEAIRALEALAGSRKLSDADRDRTLLGLAMLQSARSRRESRGAHQRLDYPQTSEKYQKTTVAVFDGREIQIAFRGVRDF